MEVFDKTEFQRIRRQAEAFYKSVGKVFCPALNSTVHFSSDGFHHLQFDGSRAERAKSVQKIKMLCIRDAVGIIKKTTTTQEYRATDQGVGKLDEHGLKPLKRVEYFAFHAVTDLTKMRRINVVVRRIGDGNYHFWSVMPSWKEVKTDDSQPTRQIGGGWMLDS
ncbi:MAG: hypothetical protein WC802_03605 [Patescibacteria group bacterium]|jgi:hypothetical protein